MSNFQYSDVYMNEMEKKVTLGKFLQPAEVIP